MAHKGQGEFFRVEEQPDLFGDSRPPPYLPDPDKVRARLYKILGRGAGGAAAPLGTNPAFALSHDLSADDPVAPRAGGRPAPLRIRGRVGAAGSCLSWSTPPFLLQAA